MGEAGFSVGNGDPRRRGGQPLHALMAGLPGCVVAWTGWRVRLACRAMVYVIVLCVYLYDGGFGSELKVSPTNCIPYWQLICVRVQAGA